MKHELWMEDESQTFCLAGPYGEKARSLLGESAKLIWSCNAELYFEAMQKYYDYMQWGEYKFDSPAQDKETYISRGWKQ